MRPVFSNSAWVDARERLVLRGGRLQVVALPVRYGLVQHPKAGPTLIDTGYAAHALSGSGRGCALRLYGKLLSPRLNLAGQAAPFLARHGLTPEEISTVIVTHFHADHVSGLRLFPKARFVASGVAWGRIARRGRVQNLRHGIFSELLPDDFAARLTPVEECLVVPHPVGAKAWDIFGDGLILAVDLPGHADGHLGLYFNDRVGPLLYATDTQWMLDALPKDRRPQLAPRLIADAPKLLDRSTDIVLAFHRTGGSILLCHDPKPSQFDEVHVVSEQ